MTKYEYRKKPKKCPECGSVKIADILYGYPDFSKELERDIEDGRVQLGGCIVSGNDPVWECSECGTQFYGIGIDKNKGFAKLASTVQTK